MGKIALLVLDAQVNMFDEEFCVYNPGAILDRLEQLILSARKSNTPIIFVRNNGRKGDPDEPGSSGWEFHPRISPDGEAFIIDKANPDAFKETALDELLQKNGVTRLVIAGMQTEVCIRKTSIEAHQRGFDVTLVEDAHTTFEFDDQPAVEAIASLNNELRTILTVLPTAEIRF